MRIVSILILLLLAMSAGCQLGCEKNDPAEDLPVNQQAQIDDLIRRIQSASNAQLEADQTVLSGFGHNATVRVECRLLDSEIPVIRESGVVVLGKIYQVDGDPRALAGVQRAMSDSNIDVRLLAAWALLQSGDYSGVSLLVDALAADSYAVRYKAFAILKQAAGGRDFGYEPDGDATERGEAASRIQSYFSLIDTDARAGSP